jgi:hypothetical protein
VVHERICSKGGGKSGAGHLHQRPLLRIHASRGILDLEELLLDAAAEEGSRVRFLRFEFVIGLDTEGLRR